LDFFFVLETNAEFTKRLKEDKKYLSKGDIGGSRRTRSRKFLEEFYYIAIAL
jgi:hypothetical protein